MITKIFRHLFFLFFISVTFGVQAGTHSQDFNSNLHEKMGDKFAMKNQLLVAVKPTIDISEFIRKFSSDFRGKGSKITSSEILSSNSAKIKIVQFQFASNRSLKSLSDTVEKFDNVEWVQPNYIYNIDFDPRESAPNDPRIQDQYHHQTMSNIKAWEISTGENVLVGITDDGFDINHEDLATRFLVNKGYNFCDNNTDVTPQNFSGDHGTHVSGITAAELNNGKGGAGVAGNAIILPIKFYSGSCHWTSALIYKAYRYTADNGVKIISTSYNIDGFTEDEVFAAGLAYVSDKGVLHFNSAGNNNKKDPPRQQFKELILVASVGDQDLKSGYSNYGRGIQISAPGENILSTVPKNKYVVMSGTSMAAPNAAGSAALIWSLHPNWNRNQVAAQLIGTADNIDAQNPKYKYMLGSGRINNFRALTEKVAPAKILEVIFNPGPGTTLCIHFDKLLNPDVVNKGVHWEIKSLPDSSIIPARMKSPWSTGSMVLELLLPELKPGKYQLTIKDSLEDPFGQAIDGKGTGAAGGDFIYVFDVK